MRAIGHPSSLKSGVTILSIELEVQFVLGFETEEFE